MEPGSTDRWPGLPDVRVRGKYRSAPTDTGISTTCDDEPAAITLNIADLLNAPPWGPSTPGRRSSG